MILVKLGGSVITDKTRLRSFRQETMERLARELGRTTGSLVLVHGAGSFGHIEAKRHGLHLGHKSDAQLRHVASVQRDVRELNLMVLEALIDSGIMAVSVPPASSATFRKGEISSFSSDLFEKIVGIGLVPVTFGDIVPDSQMGFSICSGDLMMMALAKAFTPRLAVFCADVDGVFDSDPARNPQARLIPVIDMERAKALRRTTARSTDVTGSMHGKIERMLAIAQHCEKCMIVNGNAPGRLEKALLGKQVISTVVVPG